MTDRKLRRQKKKQTEKELKKKMNMFSRIPDECLACTAPFDNTNKEHVANWYVVVKEKKKVVNLYCPDCWGKARQVVEEYYKEKEHE